jgi:hypothetical protein
MENYPPKWYCFLKSKIIPNITLLLKMENYPKKIILLLKMEYYPKNYIAS